ncbi:MAG: class I adenylate-forming enzyme family protein, partial [Novosphingobium sp.]
MPSQLDNTLKAVMDALVAPGAPLEVVPFKRFGVELPSLRNAPASLPAFFEQYCGTYAEREFIIDGDLRLSFAEVYALARECAEGLVLRQGVARGERVGIAARNSANWVILYMAVLMAGGCAVLLNGWWTEGEMAAGVELSQCRLVFADPQRATRFGKAMAHCQVVRFDHGDPREGLAALLGGGAAVLPQMTGDDLASILFTSGSTGQCKGAVSDHRGVVHGALNYAGQALMILTYYNAKGFTLPAQPSALVAVPLFHVTGQVALLLASFAIGRKLVIMSRWDAGEAMRLIEAEQISYFVGVPLMSYEMAMHPDRAKFDLSSCAHFAAGGAPRPAEHVRAIREAMPNGYPLLGYGLTETNAVGCGNINENYLDKPGSTGTATRPLVEVEILDDAGA